MKYILALFIIFFLFISLFAEEMYFDISYLGVTVVKAKFNVDDTSIVVTAKSTGLAKMLKSMDNKYVAKYAKKDTLYLPQYYKKNINQKSYKEKRLTKYNREKNRAKLIDFYYPEKSKSYDIPKEIRDFFSTLFYLRFSLSDYLEFDIDANSIFWRGIAEFVDNEELKLNGKTINTKKYKITYKRISKEVKKENSDMLTNNLVGKGKVLFLWFTDDDLHIPVKAKFKMKPFSVFWYLTDYQN